jgi:hypothetical protein
MTFFNTMTLERTFLIMCLAAVLLPIHLSSLEAEGIPNFQSEIPHFDPPPKGQRSFNSPPTQKGPFETIHQAETPLFTPPTGGQKPTNSKPIRVAPFETIHQAETPLFTPRP